MTSGPGLSKPDARGVVFTVGHSTRSIDDFIALLSENRIGLLIDVRRFPGSRRYPHFGRDALAAALADHGIAYRHEPDLGGRREAEPGSPNTAWRVAGFRAYADYMASPAFRAALDRLEQAAASARTVLLCAEAVPWRCHRQLVSDALVADGFEVRHILGPGRPEAHTLNPAARRVEAGHLVYPGKTSGRSG